VPDFAAAVLEHHLGVAFLGDWIGRLDRWQGPDGPGAAEHHAVANGGFGVLVYQCSGADGYQPAPEDGAGDATVTCLALALAWVLMHVPSLGLRGAAIALVAGDLFTAVYVITESCDC